MISERARARLKLSLVFAIFLLPPAAAWLLHSLAPEWQPFGTMNHGTLITPPRPLSVEGLTAAAGGAPRALKLPGRWTLVVVASVPCESACRRALYDTRQARIALGKDAGRVQRLLVLDAAPGPSALGHIRNEHPDLETARADPEWLAPFATRDGQTPSAGSMYIVDPQGNLMMRYAPDADPEGLLKDLKRLLRVSRAG